MWGKGTEAQCMSTEDQLYDTKLIEHLSFGPL
jgi:hypothetical protein